MKKFRKQVKIANLLLRSLVRLRSMQHRVTLHKLCEFRDRDFIITKDSKMFQSAIDRKWYLAAKKIRSRISRNVSQLSHSLELFRLAVNSDDVELPKLTDIVEDLFQIEREFGSFRFDSSEDAISVITDPITFEDISLGSFEIKLFLNDIDKISDVSPYKIVAIDPNPADINSDVTHPHVSDEILCEGDGRIPIQKAIQQGRLCDFFMVISQILQTYNHCSPYVSLDNWQGVSCYDCGDAVSCDDSYYCEECEQDYCSSCIASCQICDAIACLGCSVECLDCRNLVCEQCSVECEDCHRKLCEDCVNEERLCISCQEQREVQENEEQNQEAASESEIFSNSLGETAVHA